MGKILEQVWIAAGLLLVGALIGALVVVALDPDCGPDGDSQKACAKELVDDVAGGR